MTQLTVDFGVEIPASWMVVALADVAGVSPKVDVSGLDEEDLVHFVPMAAVLEDFGGLDASKLRPIREVRKGYTGFVEGDVLFAKITPCMENGKGALVPMLPHGYAFGSTEFHVLRPSGAVSGKWLAYYLSQPDFRRVARQNMTGTAGQLRVPAKWLSAAGIPIAPRAEQDRVIEKLEELLTELDAGVTELKAAERKLTQYRQSLLKAAVEGAMTADWRAAHGPPQETGADLLQRILTERRARWEQKQLAKFARQGRAPPAGWQARYSSPFSPSAVHHLPTLPDGWVWASLDALLDEVEAGKSFKCEERPPISDEVGVAKVSAVSWGEYDEEESKTCQKKELINPGLFIREGDFLFSRANTIELVGACVIASRVTKRIMLSDKILRLKLVEPKVAQWLLAVLRSPFGRAQIKSLATGNQESMRNIGQERMRQIVVPLPPKAELLAGSALLLHALEAAAALEEAGRHCAARLAAQRKNLLKAAFAGQLVPQDSNDEPASDLLARVRTERAADTEDKPRRRRKTT